MLGHRSADTTAKHYVGNSQTESQRAMAEQIGHKQIQDILRIGDELKSKLEDLEKCLEIYRISQFTMMVASHGHTWMEMMTN